MLCCLQYHDDWPNQAAAEKPALFELVPSRLAAYRS